MLYYIMLGKLRSENSRHLGLPERYSVSEEDKVAVVASLTPSRKTLIRRDFILSHLTETFGANPKSKLMLQFARLHFNDVVERIAKPYNQVYEEHRTSIIQRLRALGAKLEPVKAKSKKSSEPATEVPVAAA